MFNLFKKKEPSVKVIDTVTITETAKLKALLAHWKSDSNIIIVFWFEESLRQAEAYFSGQTKERITLLTSREAGGQQNSGKTIVFAEHYPVRSKEETLYHKLQLTKVQVYSSLDEPFFIRFGGNKIVQLMQRLGVREDEIIQHTMINKAILAAQKKMEKKIVFEQPAHSQKNWLEKNFPV